MEGTGAPVPRRVTFISWANEMEANRTRTNVAIHLTGNLLSMSLYLMEFNKGYSSSYKDIANSTGIKQKE
jgi:hypothetical protein